VASSETALHRIDMVEGTLAKAFGCRGGYIAAIDLEASDKLCPPAFRSSSIPAV
jgi:7-keto-8-aminopelargonate synthetase-like enzyme